MAVIEDAETQQQLRAIVQSNCACSRGGPTCGAHVMVDDPASIHRLAFLKYYLPVLWHRERSEPHECAEKHWRPLLSAANAAAETAPSTPDPDEAQAND